MGRILAQVRPVDADPMTIFSGVASIDRIVVCNTTASAVTHQIFHDPAGDNYKEETALRFDKSIAAKGDDERIFDPPIETAPPATIGVQSETGYALTFTVYGDEMAIP